MAEIHQIHPEGLTSDSFTVNRNRTGPITVLWDEKGRVQEDTVRRYRKLVNNDNDNNNTAKSFSTAGQQFGN